jgi:hypothetical protein
MKSHRLCTALVERVGEAGQRGNAARTADLR